MPYKIKPIPFATAIIHKIKSKNGNNKKLLKFSCRGVTLPCGWYSKEAVPKKKCNLRQKKESEEIFFNIRWRIV